jgi:nitrite reductase/ring-hydroxylating ferredoxin subunit
MKTGKVTEGPAKVDLKVFEVTVRSGKIAVRL